MSEAPVTIQILVNGEEFAVPEGVTIPELLHHLNRDPERNGVAIAVNDTVVHRGTWASTFIADGDRVEIITASQGG